MLLKKLATAALVLLLTILAGWPAGLAKAAILQPFSISGYTVDVTLQQDGSADIIESIKIQFSKDRQDLSFILNYMDSQKLTLGNVSLDSQNSQGKADGQMFIKVMPASGLENQARLSTYEADDTGRSLQIALRTAFDGGTARIVRLTYHLEGAVILEKEAALFERPFFDTVPGIAVGNPSIIIHLPQPIKSSLHVWSLPISLTQFEMSQQDASQLSCKAGQLASGHVLVLYNLLPAEFFTQAGQAANPRDWAQLTAEARQMQSNLTSADDRRNEARSLIVILTALSLLLLGLVYLFARLETRTGRKDPLSPPGERPAVLARLLGQRKVGRLILATLVDLARRKVLQMHGFVFELAAPIDQIQDHAADRLTAYERFLLQWLFSRIASQGILSIAEIRKFARDQKTCAEYQLFGVQLMENLNSELAGRLVDTRKSRKAKQISFSFAVLYLVFAVASIVLLRSPEGLYLLLPIAGFVAYGLKFKHLTREGRDLYARGQAWAETMRRTGHLEIPAGEYYQRDLLPLAVGMGLERQLLCSPGITAAAEKQLGQIKALAVYGFHNSGKMTDSSPQKPAGPAQILAQDLRMMISMLSASWLLSSGLSW